MILGSTVINHDHMKRPDEEFVGITVEPCSGPLCSSYKITYDAPLGQILQLIEDSESCSQEIQVILRDQ